MTDGTEGTDIPVSMEELDGAFAATLLRNNKKIRQDRGVAIYEATEMVYKRKIEDTILAIKQLKREREGMMDLSPTHADSLVLASDFDQAAFVDKDVQIGIKIRQLEIELEIAQGRYSFLFKGRRLATVATELPQTS